MKHLISLLLFLPLIASSQHTDTTYYSKNGNISAKGTLVNDKKEGLWYLYDIDGTLAKEVYFVNGKVGGANYTFTGKEVDYYPSGTIKQIKKWKDGVLQGQQVAFYPNGDTLKTVFCDSLGRFNGWLKEYNEEEKVQRATLYLDDYPAYTEFYDSTETRREILIDHETKMVQCNQNGEPIDTFDYNPQKKQQSWDLKPIIYLYPDKTQHFHVILTYRGTNLFTYPIYNNEKGWHVIAKPDGTLINIEDSLEYSYLFWEGQRIRSYQFNPEKGYCIKGENTQNFLRETFSEIGLKPREYNELLVFWLPKMVNNEYNYIHFLFGEAYNQVAELEVTPEPDNKLRIFMLYSPLKKPLNTYPQTLPFLNREGNVLLEWGGAEIMQHPVLKSY